MDSKNSDIGKSEKTVIPDRFKARSTLFDFCLVVEETELWVPKASLALMSPVMEAMVFGEFKEADDSKVQLHGKLCDVLVFLRWLLRERLTDSDSSKTYNHAGRAVGIAMEDVPILIRLSDEWQIERLKDDCHAVFNSLVREAQDKKMVLEALKLADKFEESKEVMTELLTKVLRYNVTLTDLRTLPQLGDSICRKIYEGWLEKISACSCRVTTKPVVAGNICSCVLKSMPTPNGMCTDCWLPEAPPNAKPFKSADLPFNKSGKDCATCKASSIESDFCSCLPASWK